jgi:hypothetical protein
MGHQPDVIRLVEKNASSVSNPDKQDARKLWKDTDESGQGLILNTTPHVYDP